ncbi:hypothetical protein OESDEN_22693 [Oesophagostomum dentatum]|uniref:RING-type E3 ubiquitin transferase n=1 Tax=Oesophagostomum dentatum TaxID=61180 RepID=A0A0B1S2J2_OESDE|nr:hypothetical protein OESDEN_22693 [Oesophagostomum dentatum]
MGVLHMKIACGAVMMGPEWWMRQTFDQIYQDGIRNLRARYILSQLVIPVILFLSSLLAFPYLVARFYLFVAGNIFYLVGDHILKRANENNVVASHFHAQILLIFDRRNYRGANNHFFSLPIYGYNQSQELYLGATLEDSVLVLRYCFPSSLIIILVVSFLRWQLNKIQGLAENIRNEKYLVGTRLVNYERNGMPSSSTEAAISS